MHLSNNKYKVLVDKNEWNKTTQESDKIVALKAEIQHLKSLLEPHDTGHIHTTISTLQHRVKELESKE